MSQNRTCSFCRRIGHNILTCNSTYLRNFEVNCINYIASITNLNNNIKISFKNFLLNEWLYNQNNVRSFAIRYCRVSSRSNIDTYIDNIINYFEPVIQYRTMILQNMIQPANDASPVVGQASSTEEADLNLRNFMTISANGSQRNIVTSIAYGLLFMEMITAIYEEKDLNSNKKFDIKLNVSENMDKHIEKCECNICYDEHENIKFINFDCGHRFCKDCVKKSLQNEKRNKYCCAFCRNEVRNFEFCEENIKNEFIELIH